MAKSMIALALAALLAIGASPAIAQFIVLDQAQDGATAPTQAPAPAGSASVCGTQPVAIARLNWPSAEVLAEIHSLILGQEFGCQTRFAPGDMSSIGSSMAAAGQPAVAPELWVGRIADIWNAGTQSQTVRQATSSYLEDSFEGWFVPAYVTAAHPELTAAAGLAAAAPTLNNRQKVRFISCPRDWACAVINRNLLAAYGLSTLVELVEPANRFEMDKLIAEAVSRNEPIVFYYWQPNAILAQFGFVPLAMGAFDEAAAKCLASAVCDSPKPSSFAPETVVVAVSDWLFSEAPTLAAYFQRSSLPLAEMNLLLAQLNETGATPATVAAQFVRDRGAVWRTWIGSDAP